MMKKTAAVLTAIFLLLSIVPMAASAQATVIFTVGSYTHEGILEAGETVTLPVTVRSASPFCALELEIWYDPQKWEAVSGSQEAFLTSNFSFHELNLQPIDNRTGEPIEGMVKIGGMGLKDVTATEDTLIAYVTLKALCPITEDEVFTAKAIKAAKAPTSELSCDGVSGTVTIEREPMQPGDINGDGAVSLPDATALFYAVNGLTTLTGEQQTAADLDGDGKTTLNDATKLFYFVNGLM